MGDTPSLAIVSGSVSTDSLRLFNVRAILMFSPPEVTAASTALMASRAFLATRTASGAAAANPAIVVKLMDSTTPDPVTKPLVEDSTMT